MAKPISPTPKLGKKATLAFLEAVAEDLPKAVGYHRDLTRLEQARAKAIANANRAKKQR